MISEAGRGLIDSLESLLGIAQIRLNKDIPFDECNIEEIITNIVGQLKANIIEKNIAINLNLAVHTVNYPKPYLESILYNLVSNAIKYHNPVVKPHISIATSTAGEKICLSVKDNGLGLNMEKYGDKIFKLNQVFHNNDDSKGIGLFLIKTQIESLGGKITVCSKVNEGAEFMVTL